MFSIGLPGLQVTLGPLGLLAPLASLASVSGGTHTGDQHQHPHPHLRAAREAGIAELRAVVEELSEKVAALSVASAKKK
ncbi:hypothetical protein [Mycobacterium sp.]|uniref:hypothetical protein n=1 Tax=Mycobacterium sp. TaxID=1785 RepID=UPI003F99CE58